MKSDLPPGPALPPLAQTARWIARPTHFMERSRREYGDVFTVRLAGVGQYVFISDPALVKQVFTASPDQLRAGEANWPLIPVLGDRSVLTLDGPKHMSRRKLLLPPSHGERLQRYRLRPPVPIVARRVKQPYELNGHTIPAGQDLAPCIWLTHRRPDVYPDPYAFKPERFLDRGPETYSWLPFGGGMRRCIGAAFAQLEMTVVMKTIAEQVDMEPAERAPEPVSRRAIVLAPKRGSRVIVSTVA
jgi:cytochrome P450